MRFVLITASVLVSATASAGEPTDQLVPPACPVNGYIPYDYPAVGSCPCGESGCFPPIRYYSCDNGYEKAFWRRWLHTHFRGGSMLDGVPCQCILPPRQIGGLPQARPIVVPPEPSEEPEPESLEPGREEESESP